MTDFPGKHTTPMQYYEEARELSLALYAVCRDKDAAPPIAMMAIGDLVSAIMMNFLPDEEDRMSAFTLWTRLTKELILSRSNGEVVQTH